MKHAGIPATFGQVSPVIKCEADRIMTLTKLIPATSKIIIEIKKSIDINLTDDNNL